MLEIFNDLRPFFEDCYRRLHVREYARLARISPPTASKLLTTYHAEGLLRKEADRRYLLFSAAQQSPLFQGLSRLYWRVQLTPLISFLEHQLTDPTVILFGSLSKAEATLASDIDLAIFATGQKPDLERFEKPLKREIQPFFFPSLKAIPNKDLAANILNGALLCGRIRL